jgi:hypothetical protein
MCVRNTVLNALHPRVSLKLGYTVRSTESLPHVAEPRSSCAPPVRPNDLGDAVRRPRCILRFEVPTAVTMKEINSGMWTRTKLDDVTFKRNILHPLYEPRYVIACVGNLTEEKSFVCLNFPPAYEHRKCVKIECSNFVTMTQRSKSVTDDDTPSSPY